MKLQDIQANKATSADAKQIIANYFSQTPSAYHDADNADALSKDLINPNKWKRIERFKPDEYDLPVDYENEKPVWVSVYTPGHQTDLIKGDAQVPFSDVVLARRFDLRSDHASVNVLTVETKDHSTYICEINFD